MEHIIDTESSMTVKFKFEAFKGDENALKKHLNNGFKKSGIWLGSFEIITEYVDFEKHLVGIEYTFEDCYSDAYGNAVWDCINKQLDSFDVTASC